MRPFGRGAAGAAKTSSLIEGARVDPARDERVRDDEEEAAGSPSGLRRGAVVAEEASGSVVEVDEDEGRDFAGGTCV